MARRETSALSCFRRLSTFTNIIKFVRHIHHFKKEKKPTRNWAKQFENKHPGEKRDQTEWKKETMFYDKVRLKYSSAITSLWLWCALSHRQPLPVGLNSADPWGRETTRTTGWALISPIITAAKKPQWESIENNEEGQYLWLGCFICVLPSLQKRGRLIFLPLLTYLAVFIADRESTLKSLRPKQTPDWTDSMSHPAALCRGFKGRC